MLARRPLFADLWWTSPDRASLDIDMTSDEKEVVVTAVLPGIQESDVRVELRDDLLTITAERREERSDEGRYWHLHERRYGKFARSVRLPAEVNADKAQANLQDGVLTVRLPRTGESPLKQIVVNARKLLTGKS